LWELPGDKSSEVTDEEYREMFKRLSKWIQNNYMQS
jgi:hypothetical protein